MMVIKTELIIGLNAQIAALDGTQTRIDLLKLKKSAVKHEIDVTPIDDQLSILDAGLSSADINTLTVAAEAALDGGSASGSGGGLGEVKFFASFGIKFEDEAGQQWLKSGEIETDLGNVDPSLGSHTLWAPVSSGNLNAQGLGSLWAKGSVVIISVSNTLNLKRSDDNGETFTNLAVTGSEILLSMNQNSVGANPNTSTWIAGCFNAKIQRSVDNGITFSEITLPTVATEEVRSIFHVSGNIWVCSTDVGSASGKVLRSIDDGATWSVINSETLYAFDYDAINDVLIGVDPYGTYWRSTDKGASWTQVASLSSTIVQYIGNQIWLASDSDTGHFISTDGGLNWSGYLGFNGLSTGKVTCWWSDKNGTLFIGVNDTDYETTKDRTTYFQSTDFGITFTETSNSLTSRPRCIVSGDSNRLFVATREYSAADSPTSYLYLDKGIGIAPAVIGGAIGYLRIK